MSQISNIFFHLVRIPRENYEFTIGELNVAWRSAQLSNPGASWVVDAQIMSGDDEFLTLDCALNNMGFLFTVHDAGVSIDGFDHEEWSNDWEVFFLALRPCLYYEDLIHGGHPVIEVFLTDGNMWRYVFTRDEVVSEAGHVTWDRDRADWLSQQAEIVLLRKALEAATKEIMHTRKLVLELAADKVKTEDCRLLVAQYSGQLEEELFEGGQK